MLGPGGDTAGCPDGTGTCPPEDCGGPHGYAELLAALADPRHPDHTEMREWGGDRLRPFDRAAADRGVGDAVGQVPASVRLLPGLLTGGVRLTPGGRLPRAVVRAVQEQRPERYPLGRPASIEEDLLPLAALHNILRHVGLLRHAHGVLRPTRAAGDEVEAVRRLRTWFPPRNFSTMVAARAVPLVTARGPLTTQDLAAVALSMLGHGWRRGHDPTTATDVLRDLRRLAHQLAGLDMLATYSPAWTAGASARRLLPGVPLLADLL